MVAAHADQHPPLHTTGCRHYHRRGDVLRWSAGVSRRNNMTHRPTLRHDRRHRRDRPLLRAVQSEHPHALVAIAADARLASKQRGDTRLRTSRLGLMLQVLHLVWATDAFGALVLYRLRAHCQRHDIPVLPRIAHRLSIAWAQVSIGDPALIEPGVLLPHGQVVIDGFTRIGSGARIRPFVTLGLVDGMVQGPTIGRNVKIGTGAKLLGPVTIGDRANIGANAVVLSDVESGAVVAGVPARPVR